MWGAMTVVMMLPAAAPALWRFHRTVRAKQPGLLTGCAGLGYFVVWTAVGIVAVPLAALQVKLSPVAVGVVVLLAGAWQLTGRKARHLACCRRALDGGSARSFDARSAWRFGMQLGLHCVRCCGNLMAIPLVLGIMDLRAMAAAGVVIGLERHASAGDRVARLTGAVALCAGVFLIFEI